MPARWLLVNHTRPVPRRREVVDGIAAGQWIRGDAPVGGAAREVRRAASVRRRTRDRRARRQGPASGETRPRRRCKSADAMLGVDPQQPARSVTGRADPTGRPDQHAASTPCRRGPRRRGPLHWTSAGRGIRCSSCTKWRPAGCSARTPARNGARHHDGVADDPSQRLLVGEVHPDVVATTGSFGGVRSAVGRWSRRSG